MQNKLPQKRISNYFYIFTMQIISVILDLFLACVFLSATFVNTRFVICNFKSMDASIKVFRAIYSIASFLVFLYFLKCMLQEMAVLPQ